MRNPARIDEIIELLREWWKTNPDHRLCQLVSNLQGPGPQDVFYLEDTNLRALLVEAIRRG